MDRVRVNLLGEFELWQGTERLRLPTRRAELLLALLALSPGPVHSREKLSAMFWPGRDEAQARTSLRQALYQVRRVLGDDGDVLETDARFVGLTPGAFDCDVAEMLDRRDDAPIETLWRGEFLAGHDPQDEALESWLLEERARLRAAALEAGLARGRGLVEEHRFVEAEAIGRRCLGIDAYDEAACRLTMTACLRQGRRNAALALYRDLSDRLRADLSTAPEARTTALFQAMRSGAGTHAAEAETPEEVPAPAEPAPRDDAVDTVSEPVVAPPVTAQERRFVTALHMRLPAPTLDVDPETAQDLDTAWFDEIASLVQRQGGRIVHIDASGMTALFGLNGQTESHGVDALRAARALIASQPAARIGVHSGLAIAGSASVAGDFLGPVAMTARGLSESAGTAQCLVTEATGGTVEGWFDFEAAREIAVSGLREPLRASVLRGETDVRSRWDLHARRQLTPFQGRAADLAVLGEMVERTEDHAAAALISGMAGIGKTRLVHEFLQPLQGAARVLRLSLSPGDAEIAYRLAGLLHRAWDATGGDASALPDRARLGLGVLTGDPTVQQEWGALGPSEQVRCIAATVEHMVTDLATGRLFLLVLEDLHWIDGPSREVLSAFISGLATPGIMVIATARPEFQPDWAGRSHVRVLTLDELTQGQAEALIAAAIGDAPDMAGVRQALAAHAGRVPLFIEEVLRQLIARGDLRPGPEGHILTRPLEELDVPVTVRGVIAARLDQLEPAARELLQTASVLGTDIEETLLQGLSGFDGGAFHDALQDLATAELLYRGREPQTWYIRHALIRDVVYQGMLRSARKSLHRRAVRMLEDRPAATGASTETLARHAMLGEMWPEATRYAAAAGARAHDLSAFTTSRRFYHDAIEALGHLPQDAAAVRQQIELRLRLRPALMLLGEKDELNRLLDEAEALAAQIDDACLSGRVLLHRSYGESTLGLIGPAIASARRAAVHAAACGDPLLAAETRLALGQALRVQCDAKAAIAALLPDYDFWTRDHPTVRGDHLGTRSVWYLGHLAAVQTLAGAFDAARRCIDAAIAISEQTGRPADRQHALFSRAETRLHQGDPEGARVDAERAVEMFEASTIWRTGTLAEIYLNAGEVDRAMTLLRRAEQRALDTGQDHILRSQVTVALAEGLFAEGALDAARERASELLRDLREQGFIRHQVRLLLLLARIAAESGDLPAARANAGNAAAIATEYGLRPDLARVEALLDRLSRATPRDSDASTADQPPTR